jgi:hypothetical protein
MRRMLLISLVPLVVACSGPASTQTAPAAGPASVVTAPKPDVQPAAAQPAAKPDAKPAAGQPAAKPAAEAKPAAPTKPQMETAAAAPKATIAPPAENHGIALGQPIKVGPNSTVVMVTNTTDQVMTFNIATTYRKGASEVVVSGTVSDLLPKQSRPAPAVSTTLIPSDPESITVAVTGVRSAAASSPKGDLARNIAMSEPKKVENSTNVTVEVTNNDSKQHNVSVYSAYLQGDELVAYGEGQAAGLKAGETRTITVRAVTPVKTNDRITVSARVI